MADSAVSGLTELATSPASNDEMYIRDESELAAAESKRIQIATLWAGFSSFRDQESGITASVTQTQGQGQLTKTLSLVSTVATADDTVTGLSTTSIGVVMAIYNSGANQLQVFPSSGDDLGEGTNTSVKIPAGDFAIWISVSATAWLHVAGTYTTT